MSQLASFARYLLRHSFVRFGFIGACGYVVGATVLAIGTGPLNLNFAQGNALAIFIAMALLGRATAISHFAPNGPLAYPAPCRNG